MLLIAGIGGDCLTTFQSAALSSMFDVGAMIGQWLSAKILFPVTCS